METSLQRVTDHYAASAGQDIAGMMAAVASDVAWTEIAGFPCAGGQRAVCMRLAATWLRHGCDMAAPKILGRPDAKSRYSSD